MSCLGSIGVVGLRIVPRRVGGAPSFAKATVDRLPRKLSPDGRRAVLAAGA
jgi:hypothetical protein